MMMKLELLAQEVAALAHQTTAAVESGNLSVIQRHVANVSRVADEMRREFADLGVTTRLAPRRTLAWTKREQSRRSTYLVGIVTSSK